MTSSDRIKEIVEYYAEKGINAAKDAFPGLTEETLNRYKRQYRKEFGEISDLIGKVRDKFTDEQLSEFLKADPSSKLRHDAKYSFDGEDIKMLVLSDTHVGSSYFDKELLISAMDEGKKQGCSIMLHAGDVLEGMSSRPGQIYELSHIGYSSQIKHAVELLSQWEMPIYFCTGNHDSWANTKSGVGIDVGEDIASKIPGAVFLGVHEGVVNILGAKFLLYHGEDGNSYATSYRLQKIVEAFTGGEKPNVLIAGHTHKQCYIFDRNIHVISAGSIQKQSGFMRYKRLAAHVGFWIISCKIRNGQIITFTPTWYPFYQ